MIPIIALMGCELAQPTARKITAISEQLSKAHKSSYENAALIESLQEISTAPAHQL